MKLVLDDGSEIPLHPLDLEDGDFVTDAVVGLAVTNMDDSFGSMTFTATPTSHSATRLGLSHFLTTMTAPYDPNEL